MQLDVHALEPRGRLWHILYSEHWWLFFKQKRYNSRFCLKDTNVHDVGAKSLKFRVLRKSHHWKCQETMAGARFQLENPTVVSGSVNNINKIRPCVLLLSHHLGSSSISNTFTIRLPSRFILARTHKKTSINHSMLAANNGSFISTWIWWEWITAEPSK